MSHNYFPINTIIKPFIYKIVQYVQTIQSKNNYYKPMLQRKIQNQKYITNHKIVAAEIKNTNHLFQTQTHTIVQYMPYLDNTQTRSSSHLISSDESFC